MKSRYELREQALAVVMSSPLLAPMQTIVEKELLHYEILNILDRGGWLDSFVFQGGTSLRLCHGAERLSEDLDFSAGKDFAAKGMDDLAAFLEMGLGARGHPTIVKPPKKRQQDPANGDVRAFTWRVEVEMEPARPDLPRQRVKIDVDNATSFTSEPRPVQRNYDVLADYRIVLHVQNTEEILASKLLALPASVALRNRPRHRDIWDICWLSNTGARARKDLLCGKIQERKFCHSWIAAAAEKVPAIVKSEAFASDMRRFLLPDRAERTLEDQRFLQYLSNESARLLQSASELLEK